MQTHLYRMILQEDYDSDLGYDMKVDTEDENE